MDIKKISQLAESSDPEMKILAVTLLIASLESKRMYNRYQAYIKRLPIPGKLKSMIKHASKEKSLKIWIDGQETTTED